MPSGIKAPKEVKEAVLAEYYTTGTPVAQLSAKYGYKRRTIYQWVEQSGRGRRSFVQRDPRRHVLLTLDETELILLMLCECDKIWKDGKQRAIMRNLENRLLDVSDELYELQSTGRSGRKAE